MADASLEVACDPQEILDRLVIEPRGEIVVPREHFVEAPAQQLHPRFRQRDFRAVARVAGNGLDSDQAFLQQRSALPADDSLVEVRLGRNVISARGTVLGKKGEDAPFASETPYAREKNTFALALSLATRLESTVGM